MRYLASGVLAVALSAFHPHAVIERARCSLLPSPNESPRPGTVAWVRNLIRTSDAVVRVTAVGPDTVSPAEAEDTLGEDVLGHPVPYYPAVRFKIDEVIRGRALPKSIRIQGGIYEADDYNDQPVPYTFVRPSGRHGSCYTFSYRTGGHYLLLLQHDQAKHWHLRQTPLAPVNEQVHGSHDPWVRWVRGLFVAASH